MPHVDMHVRVFPFEVLNWAADGEHLTSVVTAPAVMSECGCRNHQRCRCREHESTREHGNSPRNGSHEFTRDQSMLQTDSACSLVAVIPLAASVFMRTAVR